MFIEPTGRKFDKNGDIVKEWWSKQSLIEFNRRSQCIEKQYSKFKVQGKYPVRRSIAFLLELTNAILTFIFLFPHQISGKVTLGENIADNGGTKLSYFVSALTVVLKRAIVALRS